MGARLTGSPGDEQQDHQVVGQDPSIDASRDSEQIMVIEPERPDDEEAHHVGGERRPLRAQFSRQGYRHETTLHGPTCRARTRLRYVDMGERQTPVVGGRAVRALLWFLLWLVAAASLRYTCWRLFGHTPYRIDIDVYQMGGRAWLDGRPLYRGNTAFHTPVGLDLPFTYPPLAAIAFSAFAWLNMPAASVAITVLTLVLYVTVPNALS